LSSSSIYSAVKQLKFLLLALIIIMAGCSLEKESGFNRAMQNLTAHFNVLFNAKEILRLKQQSYAEAFVDNYNEFLSVYPDTIAQSQTPDKDIELAQAKANTIISVKEQSKYLGDAYLVLGKSNFLAANYFNAVEYFTYVIRTFPKRHDLLMEALVWKARSQMYLNQLPLAKLALDSAILNINPKKHQPADVFAAKLQYDINVQDYTDAEQMAKKAIKYTHDKSEELRWTFILAQVLEVNKEPGDAFKNYTIISKSNASFEMAFNASLNMIRIEDTRNGVKLSRIDRLLSLLKDPNNNEFKDQIYYQVAMFYVADKNTDNAIKYYKLSVRYSLRNQTQKGLSYLRLAEINFKVKADYVTAKKYYDSTLTSLPLNYAGYAIIQKTGNNLALLADRLQIITREDTLQALAKMDEKTRLVLIDRMVNDHVLQQQAQANATAANLNNSNNNTSGLPGATSNNSSFYFYNTNAVSQGLSDFKQRWGNRKLEDNWRRSNKSSADQTNNASAGIAGSVDPDAPAGTSPIGKKSTATAGNFRQELIKSLPLTPDLVAQSNLRIYNANVDIGNFYRDILDDKKEAINTYEYVLLHFPNDPNKPAIYYNLYRLYSDLDKAKSDRYKNILLKDYADTPFAKIISDPDYAKKLNDADAGFTQAYNEVFDLYDHKKYKEVIAAIPNLIKQYPANKFASQLSYLQTIAAGHGENLGPFRDSLQAIIKRYPDDKLITPLINQHLAYINSNAAEMQARTFVLADVDPKEVPFTLDPEFKKQTEIRKNVPLYVAPQVVQTRQQPVTEVKKQPLQTITEPAKQVVATPPVNGAILTQQNTTPTPVKIDSSLKIDHPPIKRAEIVIPSIFSISDSTNYYFVVNVNSGTTNLSSSRFGIGQFDRANYAGNGIKHLIKIIGADNQLIYVGRFLTLNGVKKYAREIAPLLPEIMKVPKDKYSFFIITKENLDKLADKKLLDSYMDYYQRTF
jgi:tetratricopeptide (TPR) repeat protein